MTAQEKAEFEERIVSRVKKEVAEALRDASVEYANRSGAKLEYVKTWGQWLAADRLTPKPEPVKVNYNETFEGRVRSIVFGYMNEVACADENCHDRSHKLARRIIAAFPDRGVPVAESEK